MKKLSDVNKLLSNGLAYRISDCYLQKIKSKSIFSINVWDFYSGILHKKHVYLLENFI
jgi:hypothetical protein